MTMPPTSRATRVTASTSGSTQAAGGHQEAPAAAPGAVASDGRPPRGAGTSGSGRGKSGGRGKTGGGTTSASGPARRGSASDQVRGTSAKKVQGKGGQQRAGGTGQTAKRREPSGKDGRVGKSTKDSGVTEASAKGTEERFLDEQRQALVGERRTYEEQAQALRAEADTLAQEMEPGDVQFDEESGEGGTTTVDRERDLALSAQALSAIEEIDHALAKMDAGTYGLCERCQNPIPRQRLRALPQARLCIPCKSGGLSRR